MKKRYTFFIFILSLTITVSAESKYGAIQYVKHSLSLTDNDEIKCIGINL